MKRQHLIFILALLLALSSVNAAFYTDFRSPRAVCDEAGNLKMLTIHNGRVIEPSEMKITAVDEFGTKFDVAGKWYVGNQPVTFIKGANPLEYTDVEFRADTKFPKNENYKIYFAYKRTLESYDYTTLEIVANCPGVTCNSNAQCAMTEKCESGRCTNLRCNVCQKPYLNQCIPKCDDGNTCTDDYCREGICENTAIQNCCLDDTGCDDNSLCTDDRCVAGRCQHKDVVCTETDICVTGACVEGKGCVYENNLTCLNEENRRYVLQVGEPTVTHKDSKPTSIWSAILTLLRNFFA